MQSVWFPEASSSLMGFFHLCSQHPSTHSHRPLSHTHHHHQHDHVFPSPHSVSMPLWYVCGMPTGWGCPPVLTWHWLQGPGHIWSLREADHVHRALRARGKLETVMNRTIAGGRTDTEGFSVQRMCPSKQSYLWSRTQGSMSSVRVDGWRTEKKRKKAEWWCTSNMSIN